MTTRIVIEDTAKALAAAHANGRPVRFWLNTANQVVGRWQAKSGRTIAVGHSYELGYKPVAFEGMAPHDNWAEGGMPATLDDINAYCARDAAEH